MSEDFYTQYIQPYELIIYKICRAYAHDSDLEDYYQEVCLQLWRSRANFEGRASYSTWVYRLTLNVCLSLDSRQKKRKKAEYEIQNLQINADDYQDRQENLSKLYRAIRALGPIDRAIILLYLEKKKHKEIAAILGLSSTNISTRIYRIKKTLKNNYNAY